MRSAYNEILPALALYQKSWPLFFYVEIIVTEPNLYLKAKLPVILFRLSCYFL